MTYRYPTILFLLSIAIVSCNKEPHNNPFDDPSLKPPVDSTAWANLDPNSFAGIHYYIFRPTCANSGCHDGNFEPDFRTVESAYNTLVYHPVVKNNVSGTFEYRVKPMDDNLSVLIERLTNDIDGFSGIMPLSVDPDSDWNEKKGQYIQNIRNWINSGAKDMFEQDPVQGNREPQMLGVAGLVGGNPNPLPRKPGKGAILVPQGTSSIDIWVALEDDVTPVTALTNNKIKVSLMREDFSAADEFSMNVSGSANTYPGYFGDPVPYHHRFTLANPYSYGGPGTIIYFRVYVQDQHNPVTEIPKSGSFNYIKDYFAIELQ